MSDIIRPISFAPVPVHGRQQATATLAATVWRMLGQAVRVVTARRQLAALAELDDRMLQDLGISRAQANFEASRSLWDLSRGR